MCLLHAEPGLAKLLGFRPALSGDIARQRKDLLVDGVQNPGCLGEEVMVKLIGRRDPVLCANYHWGRVQIVETELGNVLSHILQEGTTGAGVAGKHHLAGFADGFYNLRVVQWHQGVEVNDFRFQAVFFTQFLGRVHSTVQGRANSQNCQVFALADDVGVANGNLIFFRRDASFVELLAYIVDPLALKEHHRVGAVQGGFHQALGFPGGGGEADLQARDVGAQGRPILAVLRAIFGAYRYPQYYRHLQNTSGHGLPLRKLVENLVPGAANEVGVHQFHNHAPAAHTVAYGGAYNGGLRDGGVKQAAAGDRVRHAPVDGKRAAPVPDVLSVGDKGGILIELIQNNFADAVPEVVELHFAHGLAVLEGGALLALDFLPQGAFLLGRGEFRLAGGVKGGDFLIGEHQTFHIGGVVVKIGVGGHGGVGSVLADTGHALHGFRHDLLKAAVGGYAGDMLEQFFKLKENRTDVKTEVMAGITTFMTMAYILAVNPNILSAAGMDANAVLIATALASFVGTALMALLANYPFALAPGMGLNAYFAFTVVLGKGYSWQIALLAVFVEGLIFIVLSLTNVREAIFNAIPMTLKSAVSVGIGLFIAFIGLQNAKIIINDDTTLLTYQKFAGEEFSTVGITALLALIGILITAVLLIKNVKGGILFGILITWVLGMICELAGLYVPNPDAGWFSVIPHAIVSFDFSAIGNTFGQVFKADFASVKILDFIVIMFSFLFVDLFDTLGTLIGVSSKANMLDKDGKLPRIRGALLADAVATSIGAIFGTSTTTTYVESAAGVTEGGRTGLTAIVTGLLFLLALIFSPLFLTIPSFATAPALVIVGFYMMGSVAKIDFNDMTDAIPAFLCIIAMPLAYSISEGIAIGVISWTVISLISGKAREKKVSVLMYILTVLFILKYIFL